MILEADMGEHKCPEALAVLREVAREFLEHEAGEHESDDEDEEDRVDPRPAVGGTP
jgi:hypothetical protein